MAKVVGGGAMGGGGVGLPLGGHFSRAGPGPREAEIYPADMPFVETLDEAAHFRNGSQVYSHQISPWQEKDPLNLTKQKAS